MPLFEDIINRIPGLNFIAARGMFLTPTGEETYPVFFANEILGGHHGFNDLEHLAKQSVDRLQVPMLASVRQHTLPNGTIKKRTTYILEKMPPERIFDIPDYDISEFWKVLVEGEYEGTLETQYAPDVNGKRPLFQKNEISDAAYQGGYASDQAQINGDDPIWVNEYNASVPHVWQRQRFGSTSKWGMPIKIFGESYENGDYIDNIFTWVEKGSSAPATPPQIVNGYKNNSPEGWTGKPEWPEGSTYEEYVLTHDLYRSTGSKDVYGDLKTPWQIPVKINTDPQLVRYGSIPSSKEFFNETFWRGYYSPGLDTHMASRPNAESNQWSITQIDGESGEYPAFSYKNFPLGYEPTLADAPQTAEGLDNGWTDTLTAVGESQVRHVSTCRKFSNGSLKRPWSVPMPFNGEDVIRVIAVPIGSETFKYTITNGTKAITPSEIVLEARLYRGLSRITDNVTFRWRKQTSSSQQPFEYPVIASSQPIGTAPNRKEQYLESGKKLQIFPENIHDIQNYSVEAIFQGEDYFDPITLKDVTDSPGHKVEIFSESGYTFKNQTGSKVFTAKFFKDGLELNPLPSGLQLHWFLDTVAIVGNPQNSVTINGAQITGVATLKLEARYGNDIVVYDTETLTDLEDGEALMYQFSRSAVTVASQIPSDSWASEASSGWTSFPTGAIWQRFKKSTDVNWSNPIRIAGESGKPNGGFVQVAFINSINQPATPTGVISGLLPATAGYSSEPPPKEENKGLYQTVGTFLKNQNTTSQELIPANWTLQGSWSVPRLISAKDEGASGGGVKGDQGFNGWTPVCSLVVRTPQNTVRSGAIQPDDHIVQKIIDWTGGGGDKPSANVYVGQNGFTSVLSQATNIRGHRGVDGVFNPTTDYWDGSTYEISGSNGSPNFESWSFKFRADKAGCVHYSIRAYRNGGSSRTVNFTLGSAFTNKMVPAQRSFSSGSAYRTYVVLDGALYDINNNKNGHEYRASIYLDGSTWKLRVIFEDDRVYVADGVYHTNKAFN